MGMNTNLHCKEEKMEIKTHIFDVVGLGKYPTIQIAAGTNSIDIYPTFEQVKQLRDELDKFVKQLEEKKHLPDPNSEWIDIDLTEKVGVE